MIADFECLESPVQELTFKKIGPHIEKRTNNHPYMLGSRTDSGLHNNYAYMISDQCPWHITLESRTKRISFTGPMPVQIDSCLLAVSDLNPSISAFNRAVLCRRFPSIAIREALINAVIHFDASRFEDITVELKEDLIVISSPGTLYDRSRPAYMSGPRNMNMGILLRAINYAKLNGSGINNIKASYRFSGKAPCFKEIDGRFTVFLPALNLKGDSSFSNKNRVCKELSNRPGINIMELSSETMLSIHELKKVLSLMESDGTVFTLGIGAKRMVFLTDPTNRDSYLPEAS